MAFGNTRCAAADINLNNELEMTMKMRVSEMVQPLLGLVLLIAIVLAVLAVMAPFLTAIIWAVILVSATWKPFQWLSRRLGNRDTLAATLIVSALLLFILVPLLVASVDFAQQLTHLARTIPEQVQAGLPELPNWISGLPLIGEWAAEQWLALQNQDYQILTQLKGMVAPAARIMLSMASALGGGLMMLLISIIIAGLLYAEGERLHRWVIALARRWLVPLAKTCCRSATARSAVWCMALSVRRWRRGFWLGLVWRLPGCPMP